MLRVEITGSLRSWVKWPVNAEGDRMGRRTSTDAKTDGRRE